MHCIKRLWLINTIILFLLGAWCFGGNQTVLAQGEFASTLNRDNQIQKPEINPFDNLAVVLVIDISGSMLNNDPLRLRETSAGMFIDLLGADDLLSVIVFNHEAETVKPLSPVGDPADREALMRQLSPKLDPGGNTDFIKAFELAHKQFAGINIQDRLPIIVFLTDGEPNPYPDAKYDDDFMAGYLETLWDKLGLLRNEKIPIYAVGFSDEIDPDVIRRISEDTRGEYFILQEPAEVLTAFYRVLEALKERRSFLEEEFSLREGTSHILSFEVDANIRQHNIIILGDAEEDPISVSVKPPGGTAGDIDELLVGGRDNYKAVILSRPRESHYGKWEMEIKGKGDVIAMGNSDLFVEAIMIAPDMGVIYPLYEPMDIYMEVVTREKYEDAIFNLDLKVTAPGDGEYTTVNLVSDGRGFRGVYDRFDHQGDYEFNWRLYKGEDLIYINTSLISVQRNVPVISSDFFVPDEGFRLGEELVLSAWLNARGQRLREGPHLQVDTFTMQIEYEDGTSMELELYDSGDREHGNSREGDGIWSNRLSFNREGSAQASLVAAGQYRDSAFLVSESYEFRVFAPGNISVRVLPAELWTVDEGKVSVPLIITSQSPFSQVLRVHSPNEEIALERNRLAVLPFETKEIAFDASFIESVGIGSYYLTLEFETEDGMTIVQPGTLDFEVMILTGTEALQRQYFDVGLGLAIIIGSIILLTVITFGFGNLLNRFYLQPRLKVKGILYLKEDSGNDGNNEDRGQKVELSRAGKKKIVISFKQPNPGADFIIKNDSYDHNMIIYNSWHDSLPGFLKGWKALFKPRLTVVTILECTPPGILVVGGKVKTRTELHPGDEFETGGITFNYSVDSDSAIQSRRRGVNILDDKM